MKATNDKVIVQADNGQKDFIMMGGVPLRSALQFDTHYGRRSPVIAKVAYDTDLFSKNELLVLHHNTLYLPSPYHLYEDLYSIPATGNIIFAKLNIYTGGLFPVLDNILCDRIPIDTKIDLPPSQQTYHKDRSIVTNSMVHPYNPGMEIFHRPFANYEINYVFEGVEHRQVKVPASQVCGFVGKN